MNLPQTQEQIPVCWLIGPNVPPAAVEHLRSMGLHVELADDVPDQAEWFVCSSTFCPPDYEPRIFQGWRPADCFARSLCVSGLLHCSHGGWSEEATGRTVSALNPPSPAIISHPPAVMLLTKDWAEADQLLEMASKARFQETILASPSMENLAELAGDFGKIATVRSPFRPTEERLPWGKPDQLVTLTAIDLLNHYAFANAIGHAIWLLKHDKKQYKRRKLPKRKAWGHIQNFYPKESQVRIGLLLANEKDANLARELVADRHEMLVISWDADAFGEFSAQANPQQIFFDPGLVYFPEIPALSPEENSDLGARMNVRLSFCGARRALLPSNWKAAGFPTLFQESSDLDEDPSAVEHLFGLLQQALRTESACRFQFHLDGGWTLATDQAAFQWSPSRQQLRLHTQAQTTTAFWKTRIYVEASPHALAFNIQFPYVQDDVEQPVAIRPMFVQQEFASSTATPNMRIYQGPVA